MTLTVVVGARSALECAADRHQRIDNLCQPQAMKHANAQSLDQIYDVAFDFRSTILCANGLYLTTAIEINRASL